MMKKFLSYVLAMMLVFCILPMTANAAEEVEKNYLPDGSYYTVQLNLAQTRASTSGNKTYTYYNSAGEEGFQVVLSGSFNYTGSSATCTSSSVDVSISDSAWYVISRSSGKSGNKATASVTMGERVAGATVMKVPVNLTLSCDANGKLS